MLPAAVSLRKQGASNGATTAFLISTPESGVDSISITYALLDPIMTVARPVVAFVTAAVAGITENLFGSNNPTSRITPDLSCPVDGCCDGQNCSPEEHRRHHSFWEKFSAGMRFAIGDLWEDLAGWFLIGLVLAGLITVLIPADMFSKYLGAGLPAMLIMLAVGIPLYICATASTPIAAALILKGVSPGAISFSRTGVKHGFSDGPYRHAGQAGHRHLPGIHSGLRRPVRFNRRSGLRVIRHFGPGGGGPGF
ncbi:MAG: permease [Desulfobacterales bacterium]